MRPFVILIAADAGIALATLGLAIGFWLRLATIWTVYVVLLIRATGAAFHWPAMQASTTLMVPQKNLARVGGLNQTLFGLAGIVIPPLGALALEVLPMPGLLSIDIATAALAELYALLSALANCPPRQGIAVTGSINQHGQVQPVGGLDEKIEGFFDICRSRGTVQRLGDPRRGRGDPVTQRLAGW